jgi:hypothetical protein
MIETFWFVICIFISRTVSCRYLDFQCEGDNCQTDDRSEKSLKIQKHNDYDRLIKLTNKNDKMNKIAWDKIDSGLHETQNKTNEQILGKEDKNNWVYQK